MQSSAEFLLLKAVQSFYVDSRACVRVGNDVSEWFPVNIGLRQGCVSGKSPGFSISLCYS